MNKREAKRRANFLAACILRNTLNDGFDVAEEMDLERYSEDHERIETALRDIIHSLLMRSDEREHQKRVFLVREAFRLRNEDK